MMKSTGSMLLQGKIKAKGYMKRMKSLWDTKYQCFHIFPTEIYGKGQYSCEQNVIQRWQTKITRYNWLRHCCYY